MFRSVYLDFCYKVGPMVNEDAEWEVRGPDPTAMHWVSKVTAGAVPKKYQRVPNRKCFRMGHPRNRPLPLD